MKVYDSCRLTRITRRWRNEQSRRSARSCRFRLKVEKRRRENLVSVLWCLRDFSTFSLSSADRTRLVVKLVGKWIITNRQRGENHWCGISIETVGFLLLTSARFGWLSSRHVYDSRRPLIPTLGEMLRTHPKYKNKTTGRNLNNQISIERRDPVPPAPAPAPAPHLLFCAKKRNDLMSSQRDDCACCWFYFLSWRIIWHPASQYRMSLALSSN